MPDKDGDLTDRNGELVPRWGVGKIMSLTLAITEGGMRRRYTRDKDGQLTDRHGNLAPIWGTGDIVGLSLELTPAESRAERGRGEAGSFRSNDHDNGNDEEKEVTDRPHSPQSPAAEVWAHYVKVQKPRRKVLDPETSEIIGRALQVATVEECKRAIDGNKASPHHQGLNDRGRKYNAIGDILRGRRNRGETTRQRIDYYLDRAERAGLTGSEGGVRSADAYTVGVHKRYVLDAEGSDDEVVRQRGEEGEAWLKEQGWLVVRDGGKVRFETA